MRSVLIFCFCSTTFFGLPRVSGFVWPSDEIAKKTPARTSAGRRAAKYSSCEICTFVMSAILPPGDADEFAELVASGGLAEQLGDVKSVCAMEQLAGLLNRQNVDIKMFEDGTAKFGKFESADSSRTVQFQSSTDDAKKFHWKSYAVQHACTETFRSGGAETVVKSIKKEFGRKFDDETADQLKQRMLQVFVSGCKKTKACMAQRAELATVEATTSRDEQRAKTDTLFAATDLDWEAPKVVDYDKHINYYSVLGVSEGAPMKEIVSAHQAIENLFTTQAMMVKLGVDALGKEDSSKTVQELETAMRILTDQPTRRQYDRDRDYMKLYAKISGTKVPKDKPSFDGSAAMGLLTGRPIDGTSEDKVKTTDSTTKAEL